MVFPSLISEIWGDGCRLNQKIKEWNKSEAVSILMKIEIYRISDFIEALELEDQYRHHCLMTKHYLMH